MRSLTSTLEAEQQDTSVAALYKFVIDGDTFSQARIIEIDHVEEPFHQQARILLDNSDGAVTKDYFGLEGVLSYGATTALPGDEFSASAPLTVFSKEVHSSPGVRTVQLICKGLADLIAEDHASDQFTMEASDTRTVKTLLTAVLNATLPPFTHTVNYTATFDTEDSLINSYKPANGYSFSVNTTRLQVVQDLVGFTKCQMRVEADGAFHFFVPSTQGPDWLASTAYALNDYVRDPTSPANNFAFRCTTAGTTGASEPTWPTVAGNTVSDNTVVWTAVDFDEEYRVNVSGQHELLSKSDRFRLSTPNRFEVLSHPDSVDAFSGTAEDPDSSDIANMEKRIFVYATLASNAEATDLAQALLENSRLEHQRGAALVPMNVAQETGDWVKLTDSRDGGAVRLGNIRALQRIVGHGKFQMQFAFGDVANIGFAGLFLSPEMVQQGSLSGTLTTVEGLLGSTVVLSEEGLQLSATGFSTTGGSQLTALQQTIAALSARVEQLAGSQVGSQLSAEMARLNVTERLQIPVGTDKFG